MSRRLPALACSLAGLAGCGGEAPLEHVALGDSFTAGPLIPPADPAGLEYVDTWAASAGHDICATDPWINGRTTDEGAAMADHPFRAYEQDVADRILELL